MRRKERKMTTVASLFDGIGGTPLAARLSGAECLWCSEIEKFPKMVTKHHFPSMKHYGDITKINGARVEPVDIIVGGSPCQDLSVAGKRQGMKHSDFGDEETTRSGLFMEQIRIVKEMRNATETNQPRFMVWENVPGAFSSRGAGNKLEKGDAFRIVLEETAKIKDETISIPRPVGGKWANAGCIMGDGFSIAWRTYDAKYWGVAQRRRRIYLVADFGGQSAPEILFEREGVSGDIAESRSKGKGTAGDAERGTRSTDGGVGGFSYKASACAGTVGFQKEQSPTILSARHDAAICYPSDDVERVAITPKLLKIRGGCEGGQRQPCIATYSFQRSDELKESEVACTQLASQYKGATDLVVNTIDCRDLCENEEISGTLQSKSNGGQSLNYQNPVRVGTQVRRLTPLECERLQGYPDGWTDIPPQKDVTADELKFWRGVWDEWDDMQCQKHHSDNQIISWLRSESADTARYKAIGNSFAMPNILFVIQRCVEVMRCAA